ncbi:MAG: hypothetical protein RLY14_244 [Planctomycetota bacterium]|jgi:hypothetical protein
MGTLGRREWLIGCAAGVCGSSSWAQNLTAAEPISNLGINLQNLRSTQTLQKSNLYRNRMIMELRGTIEVREPLREGKKKETRSAAIEAKSTLDFEEQFSASTEKSQINSSVRYFHEAQVENSVATNGSSLQLNKDLSRIVVRYVDTDLQLHSPDGPLTPAELDLLKMPCSTLAIHEILPEKNVQIQEKWTITSQSLQRLLALEAVHESEVIALIKTHQGNQIDIEFRGELTGTAASVPTSIQIQGNLQADLHSSSITWLAMVLKEKRQISQSEPGFDVTARVRLVRKPLQEASQTIDLSLANPSETELPSLLMQRIESTRGRYQMLADRRWRLIHDNGETGIMRLIENDRIISQCNIHQLPKLDAGQQVTLEAFQAEVRKSLDKNFESFITSEEKLSETGLRMLRITTIGKTSDLPVQWIFYHLSDDSGRRLSMVFTAGGELAEKLEGSDTQIATSLRFLELPTEAKNEPTPATKPEAEVSSLPKETTASPKKVK